MDHVLPLFQKITIYECLNHVVLPALWLRGMVQLAVEEEELCGSIKTHL